MSTRRAATTFSHSGNLDAVLGRYRPLLGEALLQAITVPAARARHPPATSHEMLDEFYGQIEYHHGWRAPDLQPTRGILAS